MGNAPSGQRLGNDATTVNLNAKVFTLQVENDAGLEFNLANFDPPELGDILPRKLGFQCSLEIDLSRLSAGCLAVYSTEVKVGVGSRGAKYDVIGKKQGQETSVAVAYDQRDSKAGQCLSIYAAMPKGWFSSSSVPVVACGLGSENLFHAWNAKDLGSLKSVASEEGQNGCCSWLIYSTPEKDGSFCADVRILKTNSRTTQGRSAFLDSLQSPGSKASNQSSGLIGACKRRNSPLDANTRSAGGAAAAHDSASSGQGRSMEAASKDASLEPEPPATLEAFLAGPESQSPASVQQEQPTSFINQPGPEDMVQDSDALNDVVAATTEAVVTPCERAHSPCDSTGLESRAADNQNSQCDSTQLESRAVDKSTSDCNNLAVNNSMFTPAKRQAPAVETTVGESMDTSVNVETTAGESMDTSMHVHDAGSSSSSVARGEQLPDNSAHLVAEASSGSVPLPAVADAKSSERAVPDSKSKPSHAAGASALGLDGKLRGNKSGSVALQAKKEQEQRRKDEAVQMEQRRKKEEQKEQERALRATDGLVIATQDAEFELGLLHDQVRTLDQERTSLRKQVSQWEHSLENASQLLRNAEMRLERYGENPKIRAEADKAAQAEAEIEAEIREPLAEAKERLFVVEAEAAEKEELLAVAAFPEDDM